MEEGNLNMNGYKILMCNREDRKGGAITVLNLPIQ